MTNVTTQYATHPHFAVLPGRLVQHATRWAGGTPGPKAFRVVPNHHVSLPGWSGTAALLTGLADPEGRTIISVPLHAVAAARDAARGVDDIPALAAHVGRPHHAVERVVFRWCLDPAPLPRVGEWVDCDSERLPAWLGPFGGEALVVFADDGRYLAGVGIKRHDRFAHEIAVGTEPDARGRGLARRLVAEAARHILNSGAIPTYLHDADNWASDRVATAVGFTNTGWFALMLSDSPDVR